MEYKLFVSSFIFLLIGEIAYLHKPNSTLTLLGNNL